MAERRKNRRVDGTTAELVNTSPRRRVFESPIDSEDEQSSPDSSTSSTTSATSAAASATNTTSDQQKSLFVAYIYWLLGGWFGLHHWYLRRDEHALLYCMSFGGFGFGCLRDLWRLPAYVDEANQTYAYTAELCLSQRLNPKRPPFKFVSIIAQMIFAFYFGELFSQVFNLLAPIPEPTFPSLASVGNNWANWVIAICRFAHLLRLLSVFLRGVGVAFGVWFVGNLSRIQTARLGPILITELSYFFIHILYVIARPQTFIKSDDDDDSKFRTDEEIVLRRLNETTLLAVLAAVITYYLTKQWSSHALRIVATDPTRVQHEKTSISTPTPSPHRSWCRRFFRFTTSMWLFTFVMSSYVLNFKVDDVPLKVSLMNLRHNPETIKFLEGLSHQWSIIQSVGYERWWKDIKAQFDLGGHDAAYETLGLDPKKADEYSTSDLRRARNKLAMKYHPDKADTEGLTPAEIEGKFAEIQRAYEKILKDREEREADGRSNIKTESRANPTKTNTRPTSTSNNRRASSTASTTSSSSSSSKSAEERTREERLAQAKAAGAAAGQRARQEQAAKKAKGKQ